MGRNLGSKNKKGKSFTQVQLSVVDGTSTSQEQAQEQEVNNSDNTSAMSNQSPATPAPRILGLGHIHANNPVLLPDWVKKLTTEFDFEISGIDKAPNGSKVYKMVCRDEVCTKDSKVVEIQDRSSSNFIRHMKSFHKEKRARYNASNITGPIHGMSSESLRDLGGLEVIPSFQKEKYAKGNKHQQEFDNTWMNMIALDGLPLSAGEGDGMKMVISKLDPKIRIPDRKKIVTMLGKRHDQIMEGLRMRLQEMPSKSVHIICDIWTSRSNQAILGVRSQYVKNWELRNSILAFREFPQAHCSLNIKHAILDILSSSGLTVGQVASCTADNASNILAAFKEGRRNLPLAMTYKRIVNPIDSDGSDEDFAPQSDEDTLSEEDTGTETESDADATLSLELEEAVRSFGSIRRNSCLAHLLQLGINDCLKKDLAISHLFDKLGSIVKFFHKSAHWCSELKRRTQNVSLLRSVPTRWNSGYYMVERFLRKEVRDNINDVIRCAADAVRNSSLQEITDTEWAVLEGVYNILKPFATYTDELQGDKITSSRVIIGLIRAYSEAETVELEQDDANARESFRVFKKSLLHSVKVRFTTPNSTPLVEDAWGEKRRIVTINVFHEENYILATILDPRFKTFPFFDKLTEHTGLKGLLPTVDQVTAILKRHLEDVQKNADVAIVATLPPTPSTSSSAMTRTITVEEQEPPAKKPKSVFDLVKEVSVGALAVTKPAEDEIDEYLKLELEDSKSDPLAFWERNSKRFPGLSKLALLHLSFPASSATVERLFSTAGDICRLRRNRIKQSNVERLLNVRDRIKTIIKQ